MPILALVLLLVILALFGLGGWVVGPLLWVAVILAVLWLAGFLVGGPPGGTRGYWGRF
jgi:hypothetical protein